MKEKIDRNQRLYAYWKAHPRMTISDVGRVFHLKPDVAWRIIKRMQAREASNSKPLLAGNMPLESQRSKPYTYDEACESMGSVPFEPAFREQT